MEKEKFEKTEDTDNVQQEPKKRVSILEYFKQFKGTVTINDPSALRL